MANFQVPERLSPYVVGVNDDIRTAMQRIDDNKHRVVVVLADDRVVGTVSDGDIRRAFLRDTLPIAPVTKIMNVNCVTTLERDPSRWPALLERERVTVLPVVDGQNRLVDIALAYEPFGRAVTAPQDSEG